ncbi:MAG: cyclic nucleotide-binding domain-containing protein [Helicobacteraceae bacterium]|nr:cyclic nucleotide-binding domain-containing protein [Helicobacteraceae bacterium]
MSGFYHTEYTNTEIKRLLDIGSRHTVKQINPPEDDINKVGSKISNEFSANIDMAEQKLKEVSSRIYLFEGLKPREALSIVKNVQFLRYSLQENIFVRGDRGVEIFFILSGAVSAQNDATDRVEAGRILGETAFISRAPRSQTYIASEANATAIRFEIDEEAANDASAMLFLQLYINLSNALIKKIQAANIPLGDRL